MEKRGKSGSTTNPVSTDYADLAELARIPIKTREGWNPAAGCPFTTVRCEIVVRNLKYSRRILSFLVGEFNNIIIAVGR